MRSIRPGMQPAARRLLALVVLLSLGLPAAPARLQVDGRAFPETGKTVQGLFLQYWNAHGGLAQQGYPLSDEMQERSDADGQLYTVQYFERAVLERHPENAPPYDVLLALLGRFRYQQLYPNGAPGQHVSQAPGARLFPETGKHLGGIFLDYWERHGGLAQQGYPISEEFQEKSPLDGKVYTVQYFERAVFEWHPENAPPYNVLLSQLGAFRYQAAYAPPDVAHLTLDQFYNRVALDLGLRDPENLTAVGLPHNITAVPYNARLTDVSDSYLHQTYAIERQYLQNLAAYDAQRQTAQQAISTAALRWYLTDSLAGEAFMYDDYPLNPSTGVPIALHDLMTDYQPLADVQDAHDYITRLQAFPARIDSVLAQMQIRAQRGVVMPRSMIDDAIRQLHALTPADATASDFYATFAQKVGALSTIPATAKPTLLAAAEGAVRDAVYPAYQKLIDYLTRSEPRGRATDGVWDLPNGDAYYAYLVRHHTGTDMTPEQVHNLGLREVTRIQGEIGQALAALGYGDLSLADGLQAARQVGGFYSTNTPAGKQAVLDAFRAIISRARTSVAAEFDLMPRAAVEVRAVPEALQAGAPGGYYDPPSLDGTRPGVFYANLGRPFYPKSDMPTLAYHEAVPGHHFQQSIQAELPDAPLFQRAAIFPLPTSYVEGWGLYAETLADEAGFYKNDPYGHIGRLQAELFRASRLVVDTGIHWQHWSRRQAIDYMDTANGTTGGAYTSEVARYIAWPGQALAYKVGELQILDLRSQAQVALGPRFDLKAFHDAVLGSGSLPLPVLAQAIAQYIAGK